MAGKPRVHEIAAELGIDSKRTLEKLKEIGEFVKGPSSTVEPPVARKLKAAFAEEGVVPVPKEEKPAPAAKPAAAPAPAPEASGPADTPAPSADQPASPEAPSARAATRPRPSEPSESGIVQDKSTDVVPTSSIVRSVGGLGTNGINRTIDEMDGSLRPTSLTAIIRTMI